MNRISINVKKKNSTNNLGVLQQQNKIKITLEFGVVEDLRKS